MTNSDMTTESPKLFYGVKANISYKNYNVEKIEMSGSDKLRCNWTNLILVSNVILVATAIKPHSADGC